jgi:hypothetical protein
MSTTTSWEGLVDRVRRGAPFQQDSEAVHAIEAAVAGIGAALRHRERGELARWLPDRLRPVLMGVDQASDLTVEDMIDLVRREQGTDTGWAREHVAVVCEALGDVIGEEGRVWLANHLGDDWVDLFDSHTAHSVPPSQRGARRGGRSTLSEGHPGSDHPVSASAPHREQPDSIAVTDEPYADRKLSSGSFSRPLADGKPRTGKPIGGKD